MKAKKILAIILAIAGTSLAWFPLLVPVFISAATLILDRVFRFDYLIPAEFFPVSLSGAIMLLTAALLARSRRAVIGWGFGAAFGMLVVGQAIALITGLAQGRIGTSSWEWAIVAASLAGYSLALIVIGVGGALLLRDLFREKDHRMDEIRRFVDNDRLAKHLGVEMLELGQGKARARMTVRDHHLNSAGTLHGGAIFALADAVFSAASNSYGTLAVAVNVSISYFKAIRSGVVIATAEEISFNPKLATYLVQVLDEAGDRVALFQGTVYRKKDTLGELLA